MLGQIPEKTYAVLQNTQVDFIRAVSNSYQVPSHLYTHTLVICQLALRKVCESFQSPSALPNAIKCYFITTQTKHAGGKVDCRKNL